MKIVITGMGVVSPVGIGVEKFWKAICDGVYGIRPITRFDTEGFKFLDAGEITDFTLSPELADLADTDLATQFAATACREALDQAALAHSAERSETGLVMGTNFGGMYSGEQVIEELNGGPPATQGAFTETWYQSAVDHLARHWELAGARQTLSLSCSSGTAAIGVAADLIRAGRATRMIAGGYDALSRYAWSGLGALRTMTDDVIRPFDKNRKGTIFSEGAAVLVLESEQEAIRRGAAILGTVAGHATNNNAYHMTAPAKQGAGSARIMTAALQDAGMAASDIQHINAHGTGTRPNDVTETQAIKQTFGDNAMNIPVTSIKSTVGHMMGAAGSAEAVASLLSIRDNFVPPTIHFETPDPECDLDCVFNEKRKLEIHAVLSNSAGIGGCNAAIVLTE